MLNLSQHVYQYNTVGTKPYLCPLISQESNPEHVGRLVSSISPTVLHSQLNVAYENRPTWSTGMARE
jgi:hypothetical protein